nr:hypothetical protein TDPV-242 [Oriental turtle dovepox virus]
MIRYGIKCNEGSIALKYSARNDNIDIIKRVNWIVALCLIPLHVIYKSIKINIKFRIKY